MKVEIAILDEVNIVINGEDNLYVVTQCGALFGTEIIQFKAKELKVGVPNFFEIRKSRTTIQAEFDKLKPMITNTIPSAK